MKKMNRWIAALLCLAMVLMLAACEQTPASNGENTAPEIAGVQDSSVEAGSEFDALAGVTATDAEDGDLTGKITITSMPSLDFKNGKATPESAGAYELTYSVTDAAGETAEAYATLTVTRQTGESTVLYQMDFATAQPDGHGWEANVAEGVNATGELKDGAYVFNITDPGAGDGDIQLKKAGVALKAADYVVKIWAKSTKETYCHILARDESVEDWATFGGAYNMKIGETVAPVELRFTAPAEGSAELILNLGKITPNPDNPDDTTPTDFTVTIDKIEIYEITGSQTETPVYTNDFSAASIDGAVLSAGDGATGSGKDGDGQAVFQIDTFNTDGGGVWSVKADLGLGGNAIEEGGKYYYKFTVVAENDQTGELLVENADASLRANFNALSLKAGEETTIYQVFTAEKSIDVPVIRMQIGCPDPSAAAGMSNTITVTNLEFGKMEGDLETVKTIDSFSVPRTADDYSWGTYNGTDEDNELGVGTIWTQDGSLFYRIDQGGTVDWHNKLYMNLNLPADSYFTVEITAKASQPVSCGFFLNPAGSWDPRVSESIDFTTEEQTFTFETNDTLILEMPFEMLFQFGSADLAGMGEVTVEITGITIYQRSVM